MSYQSVKNLLLKSSDKSHAAVLQKFFKTGKGEYGDGDKFIGIKVPVLRNIAKQYKNLEMDAVQNLIQSEIHEERMTALLILIEKFKKADEKEKKKIYNFYLENLGFINNWDLVDLTAEKIIGAFLYEKERGLLYKLALSDNLWKKRTAMLSTFYFIKMGDYSTSLEIAELLLNDKHDLIHKAVGWMLREIGKRDLKTEEEFLLKYYKKMPRTMLRYAIERFDEKRRKDYLTGQQTPP